MFRVDKTILILDFPKGINMAVNNKNNEKYIKTIIHELCTYKQQEEKVIHKYVANQPTNCNKTWGMKNEILCAATRSR